jgi:tRNA-dihydrouridine synthase
MLLRDACNATSLAARVVDAVAAASGGRVAVTAKIRLGWDDTSLVHQTLPPRLADVGVAAVTVHGRTTAQRFKPSVRMAGIAQTVEAVKRRHPGVAVIGNGDIQCGGDAEAMVRQTGCDGVMLARGAMGRPWLGREVACRLATGRDGPPLPRLERARLVRSHFENLLRLRGEREAMHQIRFRVARYSPHLQPWPGLRRDVRSLQDAATFRAFWAAGMDRIAGGEHAQRGEGAVAA